MNYKKKIRIEKNKKIQSRVEFANKFKYIIKKYINKNIFKDEGEYKELKKFGIIIYSLREDILNFDGENYEIKKFIKLKVLINYKEKLNVFYLNKKFNLTNGFYFNFEYLYYETSDYYLGLIKHIEEIYEKIKLNEEIEKELNKKNITQRKRVKI